MFDYRILRLRYRIRIALKELARIDFNRVIIGSIWAWRGVAFALIVVCGDLNTGPHPLADLFVQFPPDGRLLALYFFVLVFHVLRRLIGAIFAPEGSLA